MCFFLITRALTGAWRSERSASAKLCLSAKLHRGLAIGRVVTLAKLDEAAEHPRETNAALHRLTGEAVEHDIDASAGNGTHVADANGGCAALVTMVVVPGAFAATALAGIATLWRTDVAGEVVAAPVLVAATHVLIEVGVPVDVEVAVDVLILVLVLIDVHVAIDVRIAVDV